MGSPALAPQSTELLATAPTHSEPVFVWPVSVRDGGLQLRSFGNPSPDRASLPELVPLQEAVSLWAPTTQPVLELQVAITRLTALRDSRPLAENSLDAAQAACGYNMQELREAFAVMAFDRVSSGQSKNRNAAVLYTPASGFHSELEVEARADRNLPNHPSDLASLRFSIHAGPRGGHSRLTLVFDPQATLWGETQDRYTEGLKDRPALNSETDGAKAIWTGMRVFAANLLSPSALTAQEVVPQTPSMLRSFAGVAGKVGIVAIAIPVNVVVYSVASLLWAGGCLRSGAMQLLSQFSGTEEPQLKSEPKVDAQLLAGYARALLTSDSVRYAYGSLGRAGQESWVLSLRFSKQPGEAMGEFVIAPTADGQFKVSVSGSTAGPRLYTQAQLDALVAQQSGRSQATLIEELSYKPLSVKLSAFEQALYPNGSLSVEERAHRLEYHAGALAEALPAIVRTAVSNDIALVREVISRLYAGQSPAEPIYVSEPAMRPQVNPELRERLGNLPTLNANYVLDFWNRSLENVSTTPMRRAALVRELLLLAAERKSPALEVMGELA